MYNIRLSIWLQHSNTKGLLRLINQTISQILFNQLLEAWEKKLIEVKEGFVIFKITQVQISIQIWDLCWEI